MLSLETGHLWPLLLYKFLHSPHTTSIHGFPFSKVNLQCYASKFTFLLPVPDSTFFFPFLSPLLCQHCVLFPKLLPHFPALVTISVDETTVVYFQSSQGKSYNSAKVFSAYMYSPCCSWSQYLGLHVCRE